MDLNASLQSAPMWNALNTLVEGELKLMPEYVLNLGIKHKFLLHYMQPHFANSKVFTDDTSLDIGCRELAYLCSTFRSAIAAADSKAAKAAALRNCVDVISKPPTATTCRNQQQTSKPDMLQAMANQDCTFAGKQR